ncbi:MAG TPA: DUF2189 domain-containing protein, partial [Sphingomonas sp.]|nr:DUF2189 domain-containing protein [Sphingomonas sp.]
VSARPVPLREPVPIRRITPADLRFALREGFSDFKQMRGDIWIIAIIYPLFSLAVAFASLGGVPLVLFFPMAAGLSLLGPLVAAGFYELARRRELGLEASWEHFFDVLKNPSIGAIVGVAALMLAIFGGWVWAAGAIHDAFLGNVPPPSVGAFLGQLFGTAAGWEMMIVGDAVGLVFALGVLILTWVSMPMLVDRPVDGGTAIVTSARAVMANPLMALRWGLTVAVLLVLGAIPAFIGLAVVLPWLGYATWHLYTRIVDRSALPAGE